VLGFEVAYTPGHASHHVAYFHKESGWAFVGDVCGVRVAPETHTLMPTPPPDIDVEAWHASLDTVERWEPEGIGVAHFGGHEDPAVVLADARRELDKWTELARELDEDAYFERYQAESDEKVGDKAILASMRQANDPRLAYPGLERYWRKLGHDRRSET
jgi:glyoxylase-like metal-dependent hydrolase (beta-lactamase superfamily II)